MKTYRARALRRAVSYVLAMALFFFATLTALAVGSRASAELALCSATYLPRTSRYDPVSNYVRHANADGATEEGYDELDGGIIDYTGIDGGYGSFSSVVSTTAGGNGYAEYKIESGDEGLGDTSRTAPFLDILHAKGGSYDAEGSTLGYVPVAAERSLTEYVYTVEEIDIATGSFYTPISARFTLSGIEPTFYEATGAFEAMRKYELTTNTLFSVACDGTLSVGEASRALPTDGGFARLTLIMKTELKKGYYVVNPWANEESYLTRNSYFLTGSSLYVYVDGEYLATLTGFMPTWAVDKEFSSTLCINSLRLEVNGSEQAAGSSLRLDNFYLGHYTENEGDEIASIVSDTATSLVGKSGVLNLPVNESPSSSSDGELPEGIKLNLGVYGYFKLNIYIPLTSDEGAEYEVHGLYFDEEKSKPLKCEGETELDEKRYIKYSCCFGIAETDIRSFYLSYEKNGEAKECKLRYGIPCYAASVMEDAEQSESSKRLVMNMVNYAERVLALTDGAATQSSNTESNETAKAGAAIYASLLSSYSEYVTSYEEKDFDVGSEIYEREIAPLTYTEAEYLKGVSFYFSSFEPSFGIVYSDAAIERGIAYPSNNGEGISVTGGFGSSFSRKVPGKHQAYTADGAYVEWDVACSSGGTLYSFISTYGADGAPSVYLLNDILELTVTDGEEELESVTYSLAAYIHAVSLLGERDAMLAAMALYAYADSVEAFVTSQSTGDA